MSAAPVINLQPVEVLQAELDRLEGEREGLRSRLAAVTSPGAWSSVDEASVHRALDALEARERGLRAQLDPSWRESVQARRVTAEGEAKARRDALAGLYRDLLMAAAAVADVVQQFDGPAAVLHAFTDTVGGQHGEAGGLRIRTLRQDVPADVVDGLVEPVDSRLVDRLLGTVPADWLAMPELHDPAALRAEAQRMVPPPPKGPAVAATGRRVVGAGSSPPTGAAPIAASEKGARHG